MKAFTIPTIYKAVDQFIAPVRRMAQEHAKFSSALETGLARAERVTRKLTPVFSETTKQIFAMAKAAVIAGAILGTFNFSVKSLMDYEKALQSFRVIVSSLTDDEFRKYQNAIVAVGRETKKSAIDVAASFEKIAGLNAEFAKTPAAISEVSKAAIILAKASGSELGESAESLVGIMNQFSFAADQAGRTINVLAAGQAVGAATIKQTAEAFVNFGSVAAGANISIEQSVGLIQTLGKFSIFSAEAGTKLRGAVLRLQRAGVGYASGQFNINDALEETNKKLAKLKTAKQQDAFLNKMFGAENISTGRTLLANIDLYKEFTKNVTGTNEAQRGAAINSSKLSDKIEELKAAWINMLVSSDKASSGLNYAKKIIGFVAENLERIVSIGTKILIFFVAWKAILIATRVALIAYNVVLGITGALSGTASVAIGSNAIALGAYKVALWLATAAQWALNIAMTANPIGLIIAGIVALIAIIVIAIKKYEEWGAIILLALGPVLAIIVAIAKNWDMIVKSFREGGVLAGFKAIGKVILDAVLLPIQQVAKIIANLTGAEWAKNAVKNIENIRKDLDLTVGTKLNPKAAEQEGMASRLETVQKQNVSIDIKDRTGRAEVDPGNNLIPIKLSTTLAY